MDITFKTRKLEKRLNSHGERQKAYGTQNARKIAMRLDFLMAAPNLGMVPVFPPERLHQLTADRDETFAVDLKQPYRLVFRVNHDPVPRFADGGIDKSSVTAIMVTEIVDYHE